MGVWGMNSDRTQLINPNSRACQGANYDHARIELLIERVFETEAHVENLSKAVPHILRATEPFRQPAPALGD